MKNFLYTLLLTTVFYTLLVAPSFLYATRENQNITTSFKKILSQARQLTRHPASETAGIFVGAKIQELLDPVLTYKSAAQTKQLPPDLADTQQLAMNLCVRQALDALSHHDFKTVADCIQKIAQSSWNLSEPELDNFAHLLEQLLTTFIRQEEILCIALSDPTQHAAIDWLQSVVPLWIDMVWNQECDQSVTDAKKDLDQQHYIPGWAPKKRYTGNSAKKKNAPKTSTHTRPSSEPQSDIHISQTLEPSSISTLRNNPKIIRKLLRKTARCIPTDTSSELSQPLSEKKSKLSQKQQSKKAKSPAESASQTSGSSLHTPSHANEHSLKPAPFAQQQQLSSEDIARYEQNFFNLIPDTIKNNASNLVAHILTTANEFDLSSSTSPWCTFLNDAIIHAHRNGYLDDHFDPIAHYFAAKKDKVLSYGNGLSMYMAACTTRLLASKLSNADRQKSLYADSLCYIDGALQMFDPTSDEWLQANLLGANTALEHTELFDDPIAALSKALCYLDATTKQKTTAEIAFQKTLTSMLHDRLFYCQDTMPHHCAALLARALKLPKNFLSPDLLTTYIHGYPRTFLRWCTFAWSEHSEDSLDLEAAQKTMHQLCVLADTHTSSETYGKYAEDLYKTLSFIITTSELRWNSTSLCKAVSPAALTRARILACRTLLSLSPRFWDIVTTRCSVNRTEEILAITEVLGSFYFEQQEPDQRAIQAYVTRYLNAAKNEFDKSRTSLLSSNTSNIQKINAQIVYHLGRIALQNKNRTQAITYFDQAKKFKVKKETYVLTEAYIARALLEKEPAAACTHLVALQKTTEHPYTQIIDECTSMYKRLGIAPQQEVFASFIIAMLQSSAQAKSSAVELAIVEKYFFSVPLDAEKPENFAARMRAVTHLIAAVDAFIEPARKKMLYTCIQTQLLKTVQHHEKNPKQLKMLMAQFTKEHPLHRLIKIGSEQKLAALAHKNP